MYVLQTYSVRRVEVGEKRSVYVTVAFAGVALMVAMLIGVVVIRRRSSRYPQHQVLPPPGLCTLCNVHTVTPPSTSTLTQHCPDQACQTSKLEIKFFLRAISKIFAIKVSSEHSLALVYTQMIFISF